MFFTFVKHVKHTLTGFRLRHISLVQHWIVPKLLHGMGIDQDNMRMNFFSTEHKLITSCVLTY